MGKEKRRSTSKKKRSSRLSVLDRIEELTSKESELQDASDIDARRRESIAEFQLANIETYTLEKLYKIAIFQSCKRNTGVLGHWKTDRNQQGDRGEVPGC